MKRPDVVPHGRSELSQPALYRSVQQGEEENLDLTFNTLISHTCPTPEQRQDQEQEQPEEEEDAKRVLMQRETANPAASFSRQPAEEPMNNYRSTDLQLHLHQPNVVPRTPEEQDPSHMHEPVLEQPPELDPKQNLFKQEIANLEIAVVGRTSLLKDHNLKHNYVKTGATTIPHVAAVGIPA
jgi:hypothetical protein